MKKFLGLALFFLPLTLFAGEATFTGQAELVASPEYVTLKVNITSDCYKSAAVASQANDEIANRVLAMLKSLAITSNGDEVTASGGFVKRHSGYSARLNQPICINTFRKENQLSLTTKSLEEFAQTFALLQDQIYGLGMATQADDFEKPTTFLEIETPIAGISNETRNLLEKKALTLALQEAKEKFEATLTLAGIKTYKIVNYSESNMIMPRLGNEDRKSIVAAPSAPIEFGNLTISKYLNVKFEYVGSDLDIL